TALGFTVAWLAISGVPPLAGFWAKDEGLSRAYFAGDYGVWGIGALAALLTAVYMTPATWLVFFGSERLPAAAGDAGGPAAGEAGVGPEAKETAPPPGELPPEPPPAPAWAPPQPARLAHPPHESPPTMTFPIMALALLAAVGGMLSLPFKAIEFLNDWLEPVFADARPIDPTSVVAGTTPRGHPLLVRPSGLFPS